MRKTTALLVFSALLTLLSACDAGADAEPLFEMSITVDIQAPE